MTNGDRIHGPTLFGHPSGLFTLFFAEMWERFSYYGMRALLVFYMMKGFLKYDDESAYAIYGAYTALVYMTPFFGGMIADRILGSRRAVVLGGVLMALGHLMMKFEQEVWFYTALALIITGNGFFKPNISTMVGGLYPPGSGRRDGGFTLFYMGINLGAAMAPLLCGYIGETYGWDKGFGLATLGMLTGLAVFVMPTLVTQGCIGLGALLGAWLLLTEHPSSIEVIAIHVFTAVALIGSGAAAILALNKGGFPKEVGAPPDPQALNRPSLLGFPLQHVVYAGAVLAVPVLALLVNGFAPFTANNKPFTMIPEKTIADLAAKGGISGVLSTVLNEVSKPAGLVLFLAGVLSLIYLGRNTFKLSRVPRERMFVALILIFFSMLFWSFFEQAGSSLNNFTDRNVDRMTGGEIVTQAEVGQVIQVQPTQAQLGYTNGNRVFTLDQLTELRDGATEKEFTVAWTVAPDNVGMLKAKRDHEIPASTFQSVNPVGILVFGLLFTALWAWLGARKKEPSTPFKFALGLLQLGLGFGAFWYGTTQADTRGMVAVGWLVLGYTLQTTGELCLSPVGLSMITKLSPKFLVSTMMGTWFLATAFSQYLAGIISLFTGVSHGGDGDGAASIPAPIETVGVYGGVFKGIMYAALGSAAVCFILTPLLKRWMHTDKPPEPEPPPSGDPF